MSTFYLIRHATTEQVGRSVSGRQPGIHLSEAGRRQARGLAERLADWGIDDLYSSPLERARETADALAERLARPVQRAGELNEIDYGDWTGRSFESLAQDPVWRLFNSFRSGTRIPGGETMLEVQARVVAWLHEIDRVDPERRVAVVTHCDVIRAAVLYYLGIPLDLVHRMEISPASCTAVVLETAGPRLEFLNRVYSA